MKDKEKRDVDVDIIELDTDLAGGDIITPNSFLLLFFNQ